eukprot:TRINITY_DN17634_c0_g1_i1.p2 TRINITY_DN17634_c0_g1~~TRINITY_DN17634_c0_g1_i1.p2  ORF type:complete len:120 (-),score=19.13 TRINITY_DN17634_c0_g1_i1:105-464(-)
MRATTAVSTAKATVDTASAGVSAWAPNSMLRQAANYYSPKPLLADKARAAATKADIAKRTDDRETSVGNARNQRMARFVPASLRLERLDTTRQPPSPGTSFKSAPQPPSERMATQWLLN